MKKYPLLAIALAGAMFAAGCGNAEEVIKQPDNQGESREVLSQTVNDWTKPIGIYANALNFLYHQDEGLNDGIEMVAFDFSHCENLTAEEKTLLMQYLAGEWGLSYMESDYEQLKKDKYIKVDENGFASFEKGILVSIESKGTLHGAEGGEPFLFTVQKYRTSLGAYWLVDCSAQFDGKEWSYKIGNQAIS